MVTLDVSHISKGFVNPLFIDVTLRARTPMKIGLIGDNGSGKSTLLKMLGELEPVSDGKIIWSREAKIGYLEQEIVSDTYEVSGGEKKILKITELFYGDYDVLLLDEPDNHLDLSHKQWFLDLVRDFAGIVVIISHDRVFLETAVDTIWHLEEKKITAYPFGYTKFREIYEQHMDDRQHLWEVQEKERLRLDDMVKRLRIQAAVNDKFVGRYHSAEKRYDRWVRDMVEKPPKQQTAQLAVSIGDVHTKKTAVFLEHISKTYTDTPVLKDIELHVFCGEKIAIEAPNGSGKSTLLNIIADRLKPTSGRILLGNELKLGYYAQEHLAVLDEQSTMLEELQKSKPFFHYDGIAYLKKFLFTPSQIEQPVKLLSGGQKSRLQLAKFLATNPDILVLDEPTNHLDLKTVLALENFLKAYEGTLILVSHDAELVANCVDKVYVLAHGRLRSKT